MALGVDVVLRFLENMEFKVSNIIKMEGHFKDERVKRIIEGRNLGKKNSIETLKEKMSMSGVWGVRIER